MLAPGLPVNFHQYGCNSSVKWRLLTNLEGFEEAIASFRREGLLLYFLDAFHVTVGIIKEVIAGRLALSQLCLEAINFRRQLLHLFLYRCATRCVGGVSLSK